MEIPKIDYQKLLQGDDEALTKIKIGVCETGFLIVKNTPISRAQIEDLIAEYRAFFHADMSEKAALDMANTGSNRGWGRSGGEQVNPAANPDYKEVFDVGVELDENDQRREITYYAPNLWPEKAGFRDAVLGYYRAAFDVSLNLLRQIAMAADLSPDFFDDKFDPPMALLRANFYPPRPSTAGDNDFGIAEHTDYGCLTLLAIDGVSGLEVKMPGGNWAMVDARPGEFVINFGEMLEAWSNGKIKATLHRVVGNRNERISVPFFFNPSYDTNVAPIHSGGVIRAGDYLSKRYDETYLHRQAVMM